MQKSLYLDSPTVGNLEKQVLNRVIDSGYISSFGPFVAEFEKKMAAYLHVEDSIAVQSGTAALHTALHALGIGPGDEVIVPALTFVATINPILYVGATPVIVDVNPHSWTIDPVAIEHAITSKTKAIIPVHLYGNPCDMAEIMALSKTYGLAVIEDATESLGARYQGKFTGTLGNMGCFSFNGNKMMTTGGGGMIVSSHAKHVPRIRFLINQARDVEQGMIHTEMGFNYRMTNLEAGLGLAQYDQLPSFLEKKQRFAGCYHDALQDCKGVSFQTELPGAQSAWWLTAMCYDGDIERLQVELQAAHIPTRRLFKPLLLLPYLKAYAQTTCDVSVSLYNRGLCLPSSTLNTLETLYSEIPRIKAKLSIL